MMKKIMVLSALLLSGCAASPEQQEAKNFAQAEKIMVHQKEMDEGLELLHSFHEQLAVIDVDLSHMKDSQLAVSVERYENGELISTEPVFKAISPLISNDHVTIALTADLQTETTQLVQVAFSTEEGVTTSGIVLENIVLTKDVLFVETLKDADLANGEVLLAQQFIHKVGNGVQSDLANYETVLLFKLQLVS